MHYPNQVPCNIIFLFTRPYHTINRFKFQNKVKFIKKTTEILRNEYEDDIPNTVENLCKLPGVGPKMAYLCMKSAWGESIGIGKNICKKKVLFITQ